MPIVGVGRNRETVRRNVTTRERESRGNHGLWCVLADLSSLFRSGTPVSKLHMLCAAEAHA